MTAAERAVAELEALAGSASWRDESRLAAEIPVLHARLPEGSALRARLGVLRDALVSRESERFAVERALIRRGGLRGADLVAWLAERPPEQRDLAVEQLLGIAHRPLESVALPGDLVDYVASGVGAIVRAAIDVPILPDDVVVDVGAGLGKVTMLLELLTGARTRGIELQVALAQHARACAARLGLGATCEAADARDADVDGATVVFLYLPFTGPALDAAMEQVRAAAVRRPLVVCTLGLDLGRFAWLAPRETDAFWLTVYDTRVARVPLEAHRRRTQLPSLAARVAAER